MKRSTLILLTATALALAAPTFAQRSHPGGPPAGRGPGSNSEAASSSHDSSSTTSMHGSPTEVLSRNTALAGKIRTLTGEDATTACAKFKNIGQCVAAAHVAKNLNITGGFDALRTKITDGGMSLGKAIQALSPDADAKAESKKANKQAQEDLKETSS